MKIASVVSALITSLAPMAFAQDVVKEPGREIPTEEYHYGMQLDIDKVLHRTDNSGKVGMVPAYLVYLDHDGAPHRVRFLEWGGKASHA